MSWGQYQVVFKISIFCVKKRGLCVYVCTHVHTHECASACLDMRGQCVEVACSKSTQVVRVAAAFLPAELSHQFQYKAVLKSM